ncbi:MAG: hypothetical protein ACREV4_09890 [Gammaproteobacteria bacterium]
MQHKSKKPKIDVETVYSIIFSVAWVLFHLYAGRPWDGWEDKQTNFLTFTFGPLLVYWGFWLFKKRREKWSRKPF